MIARPGSGWPGDLATARTPVARAADEVARLASSARTLPQLDARVSVCRACPRLVAWREKVARREAAARSPTSSTGAARSPASVASEPRILVARPGAGGARRRTGPAGCSPATAAATGSTPRCTGSGWPTSRTSVAADDGLQLRGVRITRSRSTARRRATSPRRTSATRAGAGWIASSACCGRGPRDRRARRLRLGGAVAGAARRRRLGARSRARLRARRRGAAADGSHGARLLPREPAEHVHRPAHRADAGCGVRPSGVDRRPGRSADPPPTRP